MKESVTKCGQCALRTQDGGHCGITGMAIDPAVDYCSKGVISPHQCELCGRFIIGSSFLEEVNGIWHEFCGGCQQKMGTCHMCDHARQCRFEQDPSPIPKMVQKQIRQGNMVAMTTVPNPERIAALCVGCHCYDKESWCWRQAEGQTCGNYKMTYGG